MTFTQDDFKRALWTFGQAALAYAVLGSPGPLSGDPLHLSSKTVLIGAVAAGFSAVKNLVLQDGTWAK